MAQEGNFQLRMPSRTIKTMPFELEWSRYRTTFDNSLRSCRFRQLKHLKLILRSPPVQASLRTLQGQPKAQIPTPTVTAKKRNRYYKKSRYLCHCRKSNPTSKLLIQTPTNNHHHKPTTSKCWNTFASRTSSCNKSANKLTSCFAFTNPKQTVDLIARLLQLLRLNHHQRKLLNQFRQ